MKKLFAGMATAMCLAAFTVAPTFAAEISDVAQNYWAGAEIVDVITHNVMSLDENNNFRPNDKVSRACFVKSLLKVLSLYSFISVYASAWLWHHAKDGSFVWRPYSSGGGYALRGTDRLMRKRLDYPAAD